MTEISDFDTHKRDLAKFLRDTLGLNISINPLSKRFNISGLYCLDAATTLVNKAFNNITITKEELETFLTQNFPKERFSLAEAKRLKSKSLEMLTLSLVFFADEEKFTDFYHNIKERLKFCPSHISLWIYNRQFKGLFLKRELEKCEELLPQMQQFLDATRSIKPEEFAESLLSIWGASNILYDYYMFRSQPKVAFEEYIENMSFLLSNEEGRYLENLRLVCDIFKFKKTEVRRFWLDKLVQEWPISSEIKIKLSRWLHEGTKLSFSQDISLLEQHKEKMLDIKTEISDERLQSSINLISLYNELLFHSNNLNLDKAIDLLIEINSYDIPQSSKEQITLQALHSLSFEPNDKIAQIIDKVTFPEFGTDSHIAISQIYLNLFDHFPEKEEYWERSLEYRDKAKQLSSQGISNPHIEKKLEHLELEISVKASPLESKKQGDLDQLEEKKSAELHDTHDTMEYPDPRDEHKMFQELKQQARENAIEATREDPEVIYSWKIGNQTYKSTDPHVILIDPDQLIFGINDLGDKKIDLSPFDEALRKGFISPNKQGKGLKYLQEIGMIEGKTNGGERTVCSTVFFRALS